MIVRESPKRDLARLIIWYPVRWIIRLLPVQRAFAFFRLLGDLHFRWGKRSIIGLIRNLERSALDQPDTTSIARTYLRNHYVDRLHIFTYPKLRNAAALASVCRLTGLEHLQNARRHGKGAIIVLGHYGPIQLPLFHLGQSGMSVIQVGLPSDEGLSWIGRHVAFRLRLHYEAMIPARILPANRFLRPLFKQLAQNDVVMMNIDPAGGGQWIGPMIPQRFLGADIPFPMGSALLSAKSGAPVIPLSISMSPDYRAECRLHAPLPPVAPGEEASCVSLLVEWYEKQVRKDPGLWHFWDEFEPGKLIVEPPR